MSTTVRLLNDARLNLWAFRLFWRLFINSAKRAPRLQWFVGVPDADVMWLAKQDKNLRETDPDDVRYLILEARREVGRRGIESTGARA